MGIVDNLTQWSESVNIAEGMSEERLSRIGSDAIKWCRDDDQSRSPWLTKHAAHLKMAMQVAEKKTFPWPDAANVKYPLLLVAALQFHARAYPAIVPGKNVVKGAITGYDPTGEKAQAAERIGKHMSYQLLEEMEEWEPDMDRGMLVLPICGCFFKKSYYNPDLERNESTAVWADKLIVHNDTTSLNRAPRISEMFCLYPQEVEERKRLGTWLDVDLEYDDQDAEKPEKFIEQHTWIDLDDDGYKEPYIVTVHENTEKVMRIVARYDDESIYCKTGQGKKASVADQRRQVERENADIVKNNQAAALLAEQRYMTDGVWVQPVQVSLSPMPDHSGMKLAKIEPIQIYTKYSFLPSPDGGFYDVGFGQLLESLSETINTNINQMLDASSLANLGGGFKAKSAKVPSGKMRAAVGEYVDIETNGLPIRESIMPFNYRGPSPSSFNLLSLLLEASKDIANIKDILLGDQPENTTATTSMITREEGMKVFTAIYKRIYRAFKRELAKLKRLNRKHLPDEQYFRVLDMDQSVMKITRSDYHFDDTDVQPVADPTVATQSQRLLKAQSAMAFVQDPDVDGYEIKRAFFQALDIPNVDMIIPPKEQLPPPEPPPEMLVAAANLKKIQADTQKVYSEIEEIKARIKKTYADAINAIADAESKEVGTQVDAYEAQVKALGDAKKEREEEDGRKSEQGITGGMAQSSPDEGSIPAPPEILGGTEGIPGGGASIGAEGQPEQDSNAGG